MLVDEVLLEHERLVLVLHHEVVEAVDLVDQQRDLRALVLVVHVLAHAGAQLLRLADVDDLAGLVLPQVHARQRGHGVRAPLDALELGGERIVGGAIPALAHGAVERGPAAALALEALGVLGIERGLGIQALEPARVCRPEAVVHVKRGGSVVGFVEFVHTASIANRTSVPLGALRSTRNAKGSPPPPPTTGDPPPEPPPETREEGCSGKALLVAHRADALRAFPTAQRTRNRVSWQISTENDHREARTGPKAPRRNRPFGIAPGRQGVRLRVADRLPSR